MFKPSISLDRVTIKAISALEQPWRDQIMGQENPSSKKIVEEEGINLAYIELNPLNGYMIKSKTKTELMLDDPKRTTRRSDQGATEPITEKKLAMRLLEHVRHATTRNLPNGYLPIMPTPGNRSSFEIAKIIQSVFMSYGIWRSRRTWRIDRIQHPKIKVRTV